MGKNCVFGHAQINWPVLWGKATTLTMRYSDHETVKIDGKTFGQKLYFELVFGPYDGAEGLLLYLH